MLRGGRVTKFKGIVASFSPELGLVSAGSSAEAVGGRGSATQSIARRLLKWSAAPLALAAASSPAFAQAQDECVEGAPGEFVCEDNGDPATTTQVLGGFNATPVVVEIEDGFDIDTSGTGMRGVEIINAEGIAINLADGANSTIIGDTDGVLLDNEDDGAINATLGNVTGRTGDGINALNTSGNGGGLALDTSAGAVSGGQNGIFARQNGTGDTTIITADVTGENANGIDVINEEDGGELIIDSTAGEVTGGNYGIRARNYGNGQNATIITADVTGLAADGINVRDDGEIGNGADITINTTLGTVTGAQDGIEAFNFATGDLSITTGNVDGEAGNGIDAINQGAGTGNLTVDTTAGAVSGLVSGIYADNNGTGNMAITTADVTGTSEDGINVENDIGTGDLTIDTTQGEVSGGLNGIISYSANSGNVSVSTADVSGAAGYGVRVRTFGSDDVSIDTTGGAVTGGTGGLYAYAADSASNISIETADVVGQADNGIRAQISGGRNIDINTIAGTITGADNGISVDHNGQGISTIVTADVIGTNGDGLSVIGGPDSYGLVIDSSAGGVTGGYDGIDVFNEGSGSTTITAGNVTGRDHGIVVQNNNRTTGLTIDTSAGSVIATDSEIGGGIVARNEGTGSTTITTAAVTAYGNGGEGGNGIDVYNAGSADDLIVDSSAGPVVGHQSGIYARNNGTGVTSITSADVTGERGYGIFAENGSTATGLTIDSSAGSVTTSEYSYSDGIRVFNNGTGDTSVIAANVASANGDGVYANNSSATTGLTVDTSAGAVSGGDNGIFALDLGTGNTSITTADVTGQSGDGINAVNLIAGGLLIDSSQGVVSGGENGIVAVNNGTGATSITAADVNGSNGRGIYAINDASATGLVINTSAGSVTGLGLDGATGFGIEVINSGSGDVQITTADVTSENADGIFVGSTGNDPAGDVIIDSSAGSVSGGRRGISASINGANSPTNREGGLSITTADVSGTDQAGINAFLLNTDGDAIIDTTAGAVSGGTDGIDLRNDGSGDSSVSTGDVIGIAGNGIEVYGGEGGEGIHSIDSTGGVVVGGGGYGILVTDEGGTDITIATADVSGVGADGIRVDGESNGTGDITVNSSAGAIDGALNGIFVDSTGVGTISITTAGVSGASEDGVYVRNEDGDGITIDSSAGPVTGGRNGIYARNDGTGDTIIMTADVTGITYDGINAISDTGSDVGDIEVNSVAGEITGGVSGIVLRNQTDDADTVVVTGNVTGQTGRGISVEGAGEGGIGAADISIDSSAGSVSGFDDGIYADNIDGSTSITSADVTSADGNGIFANVAGPSARDVTIDSTAGVVTGNVSGIDARNDGRGALSIIAAQVTGVNQDGIDAYGGFNSTGMVIDTSAGAVSGALSGIRALSYGDGVASITTGDVTGNANSGVSLTTSGSGVDIDTSAGDVSGGSFGISLTHEGEGGATITTANVSGNQADGVNSYTGFEAGALTIDTSAGAVSGGDNGVEVSHYGYGDVTVTTGEVSGVIDGIRVEANYGNIAINSVAGAVSGGADGISVTSNGEDGEDTSITTAQVTGANGDGINVRNYDSSGEIVIDSSAGAVSGGNRGIYVYNRAYRQNTTLVTSDVTGQTGAGIAVSDYGESGYGADDISVDSSAGAVSGATDGINASNGGFGDISITTANVSAQGGDGIRAENRNDTTGSLTIDSAAGSVAGDQAGINASNGGSGNTTITAANVTGVRYDGVFASNGADTNDLTINTVAGAVSGGNSGIDATNNGTGNTTIIAAAAAGGQDYGVIANNGLGAQNLTIDSVAGAVTGGEGGISADNAGSGALTINTADVTGYDDDGIDASNSGTDLIIDSSAGAVSGGAFGILASNQGSGDVQVTTGDVTVTGEQTEGQGDAVNVRNSAAGGRIAIDTTAGTVSGLRQGVYATQNGIGDLSITTADVNGFENGVSGFNQAAAVNLSIDTSAGSVSSQGAAVLARNYGSGVTSVVTGNVTSTARDGVNVRNATVGGDIAVDTTAGAVTGAEDGIDVFNSAPDADTTITTGDVTGESGTGILVDEYGEAGFGAADITIDTVAGTVTGAADGIDVTNRGVGDLSITTANVVATVGNGINAVNAAETGDLTIDTTAGAVAGGTDGIRAANNGTGTTTVTTANVTSTGNYSSGLNVDTSDAAGDLIIDTTAGLITGINTGISVGNSGTGALSIVTGDVVANAPPVDTGNRIVGGDGIYALNDLSAGDVSIDTSAGAVDATGNGIRVRQYGALDVSITTADMNGLAVDGINVVDGGEGSDGEGAISIDSSAGSVVGGRRGISAVNVGLGDLTITTASVTSGSDDGIRAVSEGARSTIDTTAGSVVGGNRGIFADHQGSDDLTITVGNVTGEGAEGILASTTQGTANILIQGGEGIASNVIGATTGIAASSEGANITVTNLDSVTGQDGDGLNLVSNGGDITVTDIGTIAGLNGNGIFASSDAGNISIQNVGLVDGITATGGVGIAAYADDGGTINIGTSGSIGTVSGETYGANGTTADGSGDITINVSNFPVTGAIGIGAVNSGAGDTNVITADVTGTGGAGIIASTTGLDVSINTLAGTVTGLTDGISTINTGTGSTTIVTADVVATTGDGINAFQGGNGLLSVVTANVTGGQNGIFARSDGIDMTINSAAGTVTGGVAGIDAQHDGTGTVTIITANVTGEAGDGIAVVNQTQGADLIINSAAGTVTGSESGIDADNNGAGALMVTSAGAVGGTGDGIAADNSAAGTDLLINGAAGGVSGGQNGIAANNLGTGGVIITTADASGTAGDGINATNSAAGIGITINSSAGAVTGGTNGIAASNLGSSVLLITAADATGIAAEGILASNSGVDTIINSTAGVVSGGTDGIGAVNASGLLVVNTANVTGAAGDGISATNTGSELIINSSAGAVFGQGNGIFADNQGTSIVNITTADVTGDSAAGIAATNNGTDLLVFSDTGSVSGDTDGITATNNGTGFLSVIAADVAGANGAGINAVNLGTDLLVNSSAGGVSGAVNGIDANNDGTGSVTITAADVTGASGVGISAYNLASAGDLTVDSSAGAVSGATAGILADQRGAGATSLLVNEVTGAVGIDSNATTGSTVITLGSTAVVTGTTGFGIDARSAGGEITVQGSSGTVIGATDGIYIRPTNGDITITNIDLVEGQAGDGLDLLTLGGAISVSDIDAIIGTGGNGITANASGGVITVQSAGSIAGSLSAIAATTDGAGAVAIDVAGQTTGVQNGIDVSTEGGAVTISNSGTLSGGDFAVLASGTNTGPITLDNSGMLASAIQFAAADDQVLNSGAFSAVGVSDFGEGEDIFVNTGTAIIASTAEFRRLEQLQSSGLIDLTNGQTDGTFTTSGDFIGDGGQLGLDVSFSQNAGDLVTIDGAATGNTELVINVPNNNFSFGNNVVIVDAGAGTEASAFNVVDGGGSATPFISFELAFDAIENDFSVNAVLEERVFEGTQFAEAAQSLWYRSADAWGDHRANARFGGSQASPVWAVIYGVSSQRDEQFSDPTGLGLDDTNLDYAQDYFGMQSGVEYPIGESLTLGVTGGYLSSAFRQDASGSRVDFDVLNIGLAASFNTGGFFADALVKYDSISGDFSDPTQGGFNGQVDGSAFGARVEAGCRIGDEGFYVEPRVSLDLQKTSLDDLEIEGQSFEFDNLNGLRGAAGLRLGGYGKASGDTKIGYFLDVSAVREFDGEADVRFRALNDVVEFQNTPIGTYAHVEAGITLDSDGPISGFFQAEGDISTDYSSFGGKVGVKVKF